MDIFFIDLEVTKHTRQISSVGFLYPPENIQEKNTSLRLLKKNLSKEKPTFISGHNYVHHDLKYLHETSVLPLLRQSKIIDSYFISMLVFPDRLSHKLSKPYKTDIQIENNPLEDSRAVHALLIHCIEQFKKLDKHVQFATNTLLETTKEFSGFFEYLNLKRQSLDISDLFLSLVKADKDMINELLETRPVEMAILLVYLHTKKQASLSRAILYSFPNIIKTLRLLQDQSYSDDELMQFAQDEFSFPGFRSFDLRDADRDLFNNKQLSQKEIVKAALNEKSILVTLPTGGGKTFAFQMPAMIKAQAYKGLTVVISPLQALMRNHVESFRDKNHNFKIAAISGYLSPIERINTLEEVKNGVIDILYLAPEALRSNSIFNILTHRFIERFVIDEAHCFSSWGHDFRHDYKYIPTFIEDLQNHSKFQKQIPVSCFTATAKPEVLDEIKSYFEDILDLSIEEFYASAERSNLSYRGIRVNDDKHKYEVLVNELSNSETKPTIIYIPQNARLCRDLSEDLKGEPRLQHKGLEIEPFYAKIDEEIDAGERYGRNKAEILNDFIENKIDIVIATTAFGMGIDKPDIKRVIHYQTSDSLESYLQESGRGGRSESIEADCLVLFCEEDFDKIFQQQNRSKVEASEIQRILQVIKRIKRNPAILSVKQIAEAAGIDTEDSLLDYDVMVKTALLELEQHEILHRGRNSTKIYATSLINTSDENIMEAIHRKLESYNNEEQVTLYDQMIRVMQALIGRSKVDPIEVDTISENVGVNRKDIHTILSELSKQKLISMDNDISAFIKDTVVNELNEHFQLENKIIECLIELPDYQSDLDLRELVTDNTSEENLVRYLKKILQGFGHLARLSKLTFKVSFRKDHAYLKNMADINKVNNHIEIRQKLSRSIINHLLNIERNESSEIEFSSYSLKESINEIAEVTIEGFHHTLVYLHDTLKEFKLRNGRLIYYQGLSLKKTPRIEEPTPYQVNRDYKQSLDNYYKQKTIAVHILHRFFTLLVDNAEQEKKHFIRDYFSFVIEKFIKDYQFDEKLIKLPVTPQRFQSILSNLNEEQTAIFVDAKSRAILVLAGPGSGKTKTLVHKIASLITLESHKPEYFLMLTHSRSAANEFRQRLIKLVGNLGYDVDIMTFHAYALQLLGKRVSETMPLGKIIGLATKRIASGKLTPPAKSMLILDEYQDISTKTFKFIKALWDGMSNDKRVIAVGDDDQCINNFEGDDCADIKYMHIFAEEFGEKDEDGNVIDIERVKDESSLQKKVFRQYSLLTNYRSQENLVEFTNQYVESLPYRLKSEPLAANKRSRGFIKITRHSSHMRMLTAVAEKIIEDPSEQIAALCKTNTDVLTLYSILKGEGLSVKYLTTRDGFRLGELHELQFFLKRWREVGLEQAETDLKDQFYKSNNYKVALDVIDRFRNHESYDSGKMSEQITHFTQYLMDIEFSEFESTKAKVIVSTIHKAKGREFESVYVLLEKGFLSDDYQYRLLYVAMTRAEENLYLHTESKYLENIKTLADEVVIDQENHFEKYPIVLTMRLGDLFLSSDGAQKGIKRSVPRAGDTVQIKKIKKQNGLVSYRLFKNGHLIGMLSKPNNDVSRLSTNIMMHEQQGYVLNPKAQVDYVVKWHTKEEKTDISYWQVLCQITMDVIAD